MDTFSRLMRGGVAAALAFATAPLAAQVPTVDSLRRVLPPVAFVFDGLVLRRGAVVDPGLQGSRNTFVVRVTRVTACPSDIGDFTGDTVSVWSEHATEPATGARARFFAAGWALSSHLALRAFSSVTLASDADAELLEARYDSATHLDARADLLQRARMATLLVLGRVTDHRAAGPAREHRTEHVPAYVELLVRIDSTRGFKLVHPDTLRVLARREVVEARLSDSTLVGPALLMLLHPESEQPGLPATYSATRWVMWDPADLRAGSDLAQLGDLSPDLGAPRALRRCAPPGAP